MPLVRLVHTGPRRFGTSATCASAGRKRRFRHEQAPVPARPERSESMAVEGTAVTGGQHPRRHEGVMDKGLKKRRDRLHLERRHRRRLDRSGLLARDDPRLRSCSSPASAHTRPPCCSSPSSRCCWSPRAYKYFNRADPDAGTTFAWTTRALGPTIGWMNGWAIFLADVLVMASLSDIAARIHLQAVRLQRTRRIESRADLAGGAVDRADDLDLLPRHRALGRNCRRRCSASRS